MHRKMDKTAEFVDKQCSLGPTPRVNLCYSGTQESRKSIRAAYTEYRDSNDSEYWIYPNLPLVNLAHWLISGD